MGRSRASPKGEYVVGTKSGLIRFAPRNLKRKSRCRPAAGAADRHISDNRKPQEQGREPAFRACEEIDRRAITLPCRGFPGLLAPTPDSLLEKFSVGGFAMPGSGKLGAVAARPT